MENDLYYKWKNGKVNTCEHVQEMMKGQIKLLQPKEESPLLQAYTAMKSIEGCRPHHIKHSLKQADFSVEEASSPGRIRDLID